jgi:transposase-like protein
VDREWLARKLESGASYEAIARELGCSASKVSYWASKHGLSSSHRSRHAARGPVDLQMLATLVEAGASVRQIAIETGRSPTTIRHWLDRLGSRTRAGIRIAEGAAARAAGESEPMLTCPIHGRTRHVRRHGGYRCNRCRSDHVVARRRRVKLQLISEAGGACALCGYDRYVGALQFHHIDPASKDFSISGKGVTRSLDAARREALKCIVLCANCHAEVEGGVADVPVRSVKLDASGSAGSDPG